MAALKITLMFLGMLVLAILLGLAMGFIVVNSQKIIEKIVQ